MRSFPSSPPATGVPLQAAPSTFRRPDAYEAARKEVSGSAPWHGHHPASVGHASQLSSRHLHLAIRMNWIMESEKATRTWHVKRSPALGTSLAVSHPDLPCLEWTQEELLSLTSEKSQVKEGRQRTEDVPSPMWPVFKMSIYLLLTCTSCCGADGDRFSGSMCWWKMKRRRFRFVVNYRAVMALFGLHFPREWGDRLTAKVGSHRGLTSASTPKWLQLNSLQSHSARWILD